MNRLKEQVCKPYLKKIRFTDYLLKQNLTDVGGVMAICLMYLTDTESTVELATNTCLTRLLRLQTNLATGEFLINDVSKVHCLFSKVPRKI
jgi:hypothetical protein